MKIKALLFDVGNVLINYQPELFISRLSKYTESSAERIFEVLLISNVGRDYTEGKISSRQFFEDCARELNLKCTEDQFRHCWCDIFTVNKEMEMLVHQLKGVFPIWILSNTNEWHFNHVKGNYPVLSHFDKFFLSHELKCQKPDPKIFKHVLEETQFKAEEIYFTDDIHENIRSAKEMGFCAHLFISYETVNKELRELGVLNGKK